MRIKILMTIFLTAIVIFPGCSSSTKVQTDVLQITQADEIKIQSTAEVAMTMLQANYPASANSVDVTVQNNSLINVYTGHDYFIEHYDGTSWNKLPLNFLIFLSLITIKPYESQNFKIDLHPEQYQYEPGKYRVCKTASTVLQIDDPNRKVYDLSAEFVITECVEGDKT